MSRKNPDDDGGLAAAYREGSGLAAVAVIRSPHGPRVVAPLAGDDGAAVDADCVEVRWWCRRAADARGVAAAANARIRRRRSNNAGVGGGVDDSDALSFCSMAVIGAATRLGIVLRSDQDIAAEARDVAARVEAEMQKQQQSGGLKSVNKTYRSYRLEASRRGERVLRYDEWMRRYRENLVRQIAAALRRI